MIITIDGPVASGKSSVAKALAQKLSFYYLNTGLLYRAVAHILVHILHTLPDPVTVESVAALKRKDLDFVAQLRYAYVDGKAQVFYKDQEITPALVAFSLEQSASLVSAQQPVRNALLEFQRSFARDHNVIADGRDCGSVVFPNADIKFYLTANMHVRVQRLLTDTTRLHQNQSPEDIGLSLLERDQRDKKRAAAPLRISVGAIVFDTSELTFEQTVEKLLHMIRMWQLDHAQAR